MRTVAVVLARAAGVALAAAPPGAVFAHAFLDRAVPRVGSTVAVAPGSVEIWFTEPLEPAFSTARVEDAAGKVVSAGKAQVDAQSPARVVVPVSALGAGTYRVSWRVLSTDSHVTVGDYTFTVRP